MATTTSTSQQKDLSKIPVGGVHLAWVIADDPRTVRGKDGAELTVLELRDPRRLSQSLVLWLDGPVGALSRAVCGTVLPLSLEAVRPGKARGQITGQVSRAAVESALALTGATS